MYLSGVPRRVDPVDFAADAVFGEGAGQEDGQVGGLKEGLLVVSWLNVHYTQYGLCRTSDDIKNLSACTHFGSP